MPTWSPCRADRACERRDPVRTPQATDGQSCRRLCCMPARGSVDRPQTPAGGSRPDHRAIAQLDDHMGDLEQHRVVRRHDGRHALALDHGAEELHDRPAGRRVELTGRLVGQEQARPGRPAPGRWPPAAAPRRTARTVDASARSARPTRSSTSSTRARRSSGSVPRRRSGSSTFSAAERIGDEPERLEDIGDRLSSKADVAGLVERGDVLAVDDDASGSSAGRGRR